MVFARWQRINMLAIAWCRAVDTGVPAGGVQTLFGMNGGPICHKSARRMFPYFSESLHGG